MQGTVGALLGLFAAGLVLYGLTRSPSSEAAAPAATPGGIQFHGDEQYVTTV